MCIKNRNSLYVYVLNGLCWGIKGMQVHCFCQNFCMAVEGVKHFKLLGCKLLVQYGLTESLD